MKKNTKKQITPKLNKCSTGIKGFDEITGGGLPKNRTTLISGRAGFEKNIFLIPD